MITFKSITTSDIDTIVSLMQEFYAIDNYPIAIETSKELFSEFISDEKLGKAWFILSDNHIVGYTILTFIFSFEYGGQIAFIDELYIMETARGKGIGKSAIEFLKFEAAKLSLKLLYLEVEHHNSNAQKLYIAAGFSLHNRNLMRLKIQK